MTHASNQKNFTRLVQRVQTSGLTRWTAFIVGAFLFSVLGTISEAAVTGGTPSPSPTVSPSPSSSASPSPSASASPSVSPSPSASPSPSPQPSCSPIANASMTIAGGGGSFNPNSI